MDILCICSFPFIVGIFLGWLSHFLPLQLLAQAFPTFRKGLTLTFCLIALVLALIVFGKLAVEFIIITDHEWLPENNTFIFESWLRFVVPYVFDGRCLSGNAAMCKLADEQIKAFVETYKGGRWLLPFCTLVPGAIAALTTWVAVWSVTESEEEETSADITPPEAEQGES